MSISKKKEREHKGGSKDLPNRFLRVQEKKHPNLEQEHRLVELEDSMPREMELEPSV